jgi:hypothetical protein
MALYSYKQQYPGPIPNRIRLSDGSTRTDPATYTSEEIQDAGYIEVSDPPSIPEGQVLEWNGTAWVLRNKTESEILAENIQIKNSIIASTQNRLDSFARTRDYDNIVSACSYATSFHQKYGEEGRYCVTARESTWDKLYQIMADVEADLRPMPGGYEDIVAELPELIWPD